LYLMRRGLEVLRKFHWMILGRRFNQLSHVSSPLLSKPGEHKAHLLEDKQISSVGVFDEVGFKRISLKGFAAALAVLLPERLKADNTKAVELAEYQTNFDNPVIEKLKLENRFLIEATTLRLKRDLITPRIVPRLWSSGPSSASNVFRRETICFGIYIVLSDDMRL
ncbi:hypothetical protein Tco_1411168, partial [Tanacetum coccineum]